MYSTRPTTTRFTRKKTSRPTTTRFTRKKPSKRGPGHPTLFKPEYVEQALVACSRWGAVDTDLALLFGVSVESIDNWKRLFPTFSQALRRGKEDFDTRRVEKSLLKKALGFEYELKQKDEEGNIISRETKYYPPDSYSLTFWLKNRNKDRWKEIRGIEAKVDTSVKVDHKHTLNLEGLTEDELSFLTRIITRTAADPPAIECGESPPALRRVR